jgi:hypothetical protein
VPNWNELLEQNASTYARVAIENIGREFPNGFYHAMSGPDDVPGLPRDVTPVFYGSYDWHSCVEMHWLLVRLLRKARELVPADEVVATLERQFDPGALAAEAAAVAGPHSRAGRPYGWGWALTLVHEVSELATRAAGSELGAAAGRWQAALGPLADVVTDCYLKWLPKATYPVRYGVHLNSAFGLSRALPHALDRSVAGDRRLAEAITRAAGKWFAGDRDYAASWEPSDVDFLSPALVEAELMAALLGPERFPEWLSGFLPGIGDRSPATLFRAVTVSDSSDGQIAHLHGLNASRAWCWRRIAFSLPAGDRRIEVADAAAAVHADAALPHVVGDHYMVEHWLAAYAVLLLT